MLDPYIGVNKGMPTDPNERLQLGLPDWAAADRHEKQKQLMELAAQLGLGMPGRDPMKYAKGGPVDSARPGPANTRNYAKGGPVK
jgi:hypothetical protein